MMVLLQQGFAVSKKAKFFEIIGTRVFLLGFLKYFRNILKCEKTYKQRNSLREHVLRSHDNISKFICGICYEKFPSRHLLKIHERAHNGEKESIEFPTNLLIFHFDYSKFLYCLILHIQLWT